MGRAVKLSNCPNPWRDSSLLIGQTTLTQTDWDTWPVHGYRASFAPQIGTKAGGLSKPVAQVITCLVICFIRQSLASHDTLRPCPAQVRLIGRGEIRSNIQQLSVSTSAPIKPLTRQQTQPGPVQSPSAPKLAPTWTEPGPKSTLLSDESLTQLDTGLDRSSPEHLQARSTQLSSVAPQQLKRLQAGTETNLPSST